MKIKQIFLALLLVFITGCTVNYNLEFNEETIEEKITITPENEQEEENTKYFDNRDFYAIIDSDKEYLYEKVKKDNSNYEFKYEYSYENFKNSRFTHCYDAYTLTNNNDIITLSTSKKFNCLIYDYMKTNNLKINITTNYKVIESNADEINGNVYTWNINDNNSNNKPIKFSYNKKQKRKITLKEFIEENKINIIVILASLSLLLIMLLSFYIKHKRVNKI